MSPPAPEPGGIYVHALDRYSLSQQWPDLERIDLQLVAMLDEALDRLQSLGYVTDRRVFMMGLSASGAFTSRFALLHPDRIKAAAAGSPGGWPLAPVAFWQGVTLKYSVGIQDLEILIGQTFDLERFRQVPLCLYGGDLDTNDALDTRGMTAAERNQICQLLDCTPNPVLARRWPVEKAIYDSVGATAQFVVYPGSATRLPARCTKISRRSSARIADRGRRSLAFLYGGSRIFLLMKSLFRGMIGLLLLQIGVLRSAEPYSGTHRPVLHGRHWVALTGKPAGALAGARMFERGGNAIDAACAMLAVVCTMHDDVGWGGETQALIYDPRTKKVVGINACGIAPTGATPEFFKQRQLRFPPGEGPLAALTPGNPGGLMVMLAEFGTLSLAEVLEPAMQMAEGYPIEAELVRKIERHASKLKQWPYSARVFFPGAGPEPAAPSPGQIWRQPDLLETLRKLADTEAAAIRSGQDRKSAIYAAYDRFYRGDLGAEFVRGSREQGGLHTLEDLAGWKVKIEEPVATSYRGIHVYKLTTWTQGPALLQALNLLEPLDLKSMGYNSTRYIHALYQVMNLAFADRDFYYGDPDAAPEEPIRGLLSKDYARQRLQQIDWSRNLPDLRPGNPYSFEDRPNPFLHHLTNWSNLKRTASPHGTPPVPAPGPGAAASWDTGSDTFDVAFRAGTTSIQAADREGWAISVTPSGGWLPVCLAGRTGMGMSQRMQSFVLDEADNPFNVLAPGKRPRVTLTPTLALKDGSPFLCFSVQGGDTQDQNLLQFFLNVVEFGMTVQEACEAANLTSYQMRSSFGEHLAEPGRLTLHSGVPFWTRRDLARMGYRLEFHDKTSGPITAILFDREHGTFWGGVSNHGEDYGLAW